jgi:hypothetical protein
MASRMHRQTYINFLLRQLACMHAVSALPYTVYGVSLFADKRAMYTCYEIFVLFLIFSVSDLSDLFSLSYVLHAALLAVRHV